MTTIHQALDHPSTVHTAAQAFERAKAAIIPLLRQAGITEVTISYDGGGDEGSIHEIAAHGADNKPIDIPAVSCEKFELHFNGSIHTEMVSLEAALEAFADTALEALHSGWEDGEGAFGELKIDVAAGTAALEHSARFISYDTTSTDI